MVISILTSKLQIPPRRSDLVQRRRLIAHLRTGLDRKLTLISAPAGFGKTTVASSWVTQSGYSTAWLSLDERDNDPTRFLTYLIAALQTIDKEIGHLVSEALHNSQPPSIDVLLTSLINDLDAVSHDFFLVLDDYHLLESPEIETAISFLLDHLPAQMHLLIITREDPQISLSRLRVRNQLTELRVTDLRFTIDEAADFLNQTMGLTLTSQDIVALEKRTEGWIAGLQLAALSLQGSSDTTAFIRAFTGTHRFVIDYLLEEVLHQQSETLRHFLLQTSILERMNSALCDAVIERDDSREILETLERNNLFVVALDDDRQWYRYHHLFADALRNTLNSEYPDDVPVLHRRASNWYVQQGQPQEAIQHILSAGDFEHAADLIEPLWPEMDTNYQSGTWFRLVKALPESIIRRCPVLCAGCGWTMLYRGELEQSEAWFQEAERWLNTASDARDEMRVVDQFQFEMLPASLSSARAYRALAMGDIPATLRHAQHSLDLTIGIDHSSRTQGMALSGLAQWAAGDLTAADRTINDLIIHMKKAGRIADAVELVFIVSDIRITCGQLRSAYHLYQQSFQMLAEMGNLMLVGMEDLYRGVVDLYREWGDWHAAENHLLAAEELGTQTISRPDWHHRLKLTAAQLKLSQGDLDAALTCANVAQKHYSRSPLPMVRSAAAIKTRIWIKQGNLDAAQSWVQRTGLTLDDEITYLREFDLITLARLLLARRSEDDLNAAQYLLERLFTAAKAGGRTGSVIEILMLKALTHEAGGDTSAAPDILHQALALAEPEGYIRLFVDEGEPVANLLRKLANRNIMSDYTRRLLASFEVSASPSTVAQALIDPLSERELDVLYLLNTDLTGPEIARKLIVSLSTVRTHTRSIYSKLDVNNRRAAVRRAEEIGLL